MAEQVESGFKWWMRYVIVPAVTCVIGGGGIVAIYISIREHPSPTVTVHEASDTKHAGGVTPEEDKAPALPVVHDQVSKKVPAKPTTSVKPRAKTVSQPKPQPVIFRSETFDHDLNEVWSSERVEVKYPTPPLIQWEVANPKGQLRMVVSDTNGLQKASWPIASKGKLAVWIKQSGYIELHDDTGLLAKIFVQVIRE